MPETTTTNPQRVAQQWESLRQALPPELTPTQLHLLRITFYSGVIAMMHINTELADLPDGDGVQALEHVDEEIKEFWIERQKWLLAHPEAFRAHAERLRKQ